MTEAPKKRGRPAKQEEIKGVKVKVAGVISDGEGGFYEVGDIIEPVDPDGLRAKGFVE